MSEDIEVIEDVEVAEPVVAEPVFTVDPVPEEVAETPTATDSLCGACKYCISATERTAICTVYDKDAVIAVTDEACHRFDI
ncbi:MAG: hypothetical protein GY832_21950 [Chloroflexi bacterium]|nr:hypothetical protein [Chloroflexota bacterium]